MTMRYFSYNELICGAADVRDEHKDARVLMDVWGLE